MDTTRSPYSGHLQKLVVSLDVGTTFSGAAYAFLDPGEVPQIQFVTRYLNTPNLGSAKVPSVLYYDRNGKFCGVENGVDVRDGDSLDGDSQEVDFLEVKWWKLMLSPTEPSAAMKAQMSTELPKGKTVVDIFADFVGYLFESTKALFKASEPNGDLLWLNVSKNIELILTHPNGWGGPQQMQLRTAAVKAGIVPDTPSGHASVSFLSEGEASFHFCATHTRACKDIKPAEQVLIIDAGGGTIDISTYTVINDVPLQVEESYEPECILQGGEFVTARARAMVQEKWKDSKFDNPDDLSAFSQKFDEGVKRVFSNDKAPQHVKFCSARDNDPRCGIKAGRFTLTGAQVSEFFEPSIQAVVSSIKDKFAKYITTNSFAFLVGGFGTSPWLSEQLEKRLSGLGLRFCKPDTHTNKAVAVGAVSFYLDRFVTGRIAKSTFGSSCSVSYQPFNQEHVMRSHKSYLDPTGKKWVTDHFEIMLTRGTKVLADHEVRFQLQCLPEAAPPRRVHQSVIKYTGLQNAPQWTDLEKDKFETLCNVQADISTAPYQIRRGKTGGMYYTRDFELVLLVGLTELKAQISWIDATTGEERRSNAEVVYDDPSDWST